MRVWVSAMTVAWAGYGDAGADHPTVRGRQLLLWVNAARVEPSAFQADYVAGGCSFAAFAPAEQTPQLPYRWDPGLSEAALRHSADMAASGLFQHDSSDGTPWSDRVWAAYPGGSIAENIAWGLPGARASVMRNWMCSAAGHRAAIMSPTYEDFGGDMVGTYATADFGAGVGGGFPPVSMGVHEPAVPGTTVDFFADWSDLGPPDTFEVVFGGVPVPLGLAYGTAEVGVYRAAGVPVDASPCHPYWFVATRGGVETRFPGTGSWSFGTCAGAGAETGFLSGQAGPIGSDASTDAWVRGTAVTVTVTGAAPGTLVALGGGTQHAAGPCLPVFGGTCLALAGTVRLLGTALADASGTAVIGFPVPMGLPAGLGVFTQPLVQDVHGNWLAGPIRSGTVQ